MSLVKSQNSSDAGFKSEYFEDLFEMEAGSFWFRARNELILWALGKYFQECTSFLEVGCGTGYVLTGVNKQFPDLALAGSELFAEGLKFARKRVATAEFFELDARKLPFSEAYDVIGAFDVLEHIEEDTQVLSELWRASRRGIILTVPQHMFLWSGVDEYACHKRRYSATELKQKVEAAGFKVVKMSSFVTSLLPLMLLSRLTKKTADQVGTSEVNLPPIIDKTLEQVLAFERSFIRAGVNLPFGGSLLLVARK